MQKGIKFHNGETLTGKDVKFSLERFASSEAILGYVRDMVSKVEMVDDSMVRVNTKSAQPHFPWYLTEQSTAGHGFVLPKDYYEQRGKEFFQQHPVGSGPFKFVKAAQSQQKRNAGPKRSVRP
ncbi:MAG: hypothetical protein HY665_01525 [Chloroflexi bacterium]|nr:hypothetical protein [Chloroflexota bacterium]